MMAYFFPGLSHAHRLEFLDYSEKLGLKVMIPLSVDVPYTAYAGDPAKHAWFVSNITSYMNHTAVVSPVPFVRSYYSRTCTDEPPLTHPGAACAAGLVHLSDSDAFSICLLVRLANPTHLCIGPRRRLQQGGGL